MSTAEKQGVLARVLDAIRGKDPVRAPRMDSWQNLVTGAGTSIDKTRATFFAPLRLLDYGELESLYYGDDICSRVVDDRADEMFRRGYKLEGSQQADVLKNIRALGADAALRDNVGWGNLWGGAGMVLGADDGQDPKEPLNLEAVKATRFINVVDRRYLQPVTYYSEPLSPKFGQPQSYLITPAFGGGYSQNVEVHESRIIIHRATRVDPITMRRLAGWSYSVLQRPYDVIRQFANSYQAAAQLMYDAGQGVLKVQRLADVLGSSVRQKFLDRLLQAEMQRYAGRMMVIDKDGEEFDRKPVQIAGVPDLLDRFMMRLAAAARMPVTRLMGRSPAGENATGASDEQMWYDSVKRDQVSMLEPMVLRLLMVLTAGKWDGKTGENSNGIEWVGLEEPDDEAAEKVEYVRAQRWAIYGPGQNGVGALTGEQIAAIEFLKKPVEDVVDEDALMKAIKADNDLLKNPPKPPAPDLAAFTGKPPALPPAPPHPGAPQLPPPQNPPPPPQRGDAARADHIVERGGKFFLMSIKDPSKQLGGPYDTRAQAEEREREVIAAEAAKGK